jgi:hypothetical protein
MRTLIAGTAIAILMLVALTAAKPHAPSKPATEYLGLRLGMSDEAAHETLEHRGHKPANGEREGKEAESESWQLRDRRFGFVALGFDEAKRLSWYTLFARRGGVNLRLADIGDLKRARQQGNYIYVWSLPAAPQRPACRVIARGTHPDSLQSLSIAAASAAPSDSAR